MGNKGSPPFVLERLGRGLATLGREHQHFGSHRRAKERRARESGVW